jgi:hypothetical protein
MMVLLLTSPALRAGEVEMRGIEGEGDRVGTVLLTAACRPDHPHPTRLGAPTSPTSWERFL